MVFGGGNLEGVELEVMSALSDAGSKPHRHHPGARRMPIEWARSATGEWVAGDIDATRWEVFCEECGDTDGPADQQSPAVQELRGPYRHEHEARRVERRHFDEH